MLDFMLWVYAGLGVVAVLLFAHDLGFWPEDSPDTALRKFYDRTRQRGISPQQASDELLMRELLVKVRTKASTWAIRDPWTAQNAVRETLSQAEHDLPRRLVPRWRAWASTLGESDVLTSQAMAVVKAHRKVYGETLMDCSWLKNSNPDRDAALRVK